MTVKEAYKLGRQATLEVVEVDTSYRGQGIYVIEFERGIKVGRSNKLCSRLKHYDSPWIQHKQRIKVYRATNSVNLERHIKWRLGRYKHENSPEFLVGIPFEKVIAFIEGVNGFKKAA